MRGLDNITIQKNDPDFMKFYNLFKGLFEKAQVFEIENKKYMVAQIEEKNNCVDISLIEIR